MKSHCIVFLDFYHILNDCVIPVKNISLSLSYTGNIAYFIWVLLNSKAVSNYMEA